MKDYLAIHYLILKSIKYFFIIKKKRFSKNQKRGKNNVQVRKNQT